MSSFVFKTEPGAVTVSTTSVLRLSITNSTGNDIKLRNDNKKKGKDYPHIDSEPLPEDPVGFFVYFSYGSNVGDMTLEKNSSNIRFSLIGSTEFDVYYDESPSKGSYWLIYPKNSLTLQKSSGLTVEISNIAVNEIPGLATIHIMLKGDGMKEQDATGVTKKEKAVIKKFKPKQKNFDVGSRFTLQWELEKSYDCDVRLDGENVVGLTERDVTARTGESYKLQVDNKAGFITTAEYKPVYNYIESFKMSGGNPQLKQLTLNWRTKNTDGCKIDKLGTLQSTGSAVYTLAVAKDTSFTLTPIETVTKKECPQMTIHFKMPVIKEFTVTHDYAYTSIANIQADADGSEFVSLEELEKYKAVPTVLISYYEPPPSPKRHVTIFSWETTNTVSCSIDGFKSGLPPCGSEQVDFIQTPRVFTITAYNECGYYAQKYHLYQ